MPATNTATVAILNLCSTERYFYKFEVECWDATEVTKIDSVLVDGKWDSSTSKWLQTDAAYFYGLTMGTVYHFRARVLPLGNGLPSSWSAFTPETAGDSTAPVVTYTGTTTLNSSSVNFNLVPTTSDTDIHHYEAVCRLITIGSSAPSAPASTDLPTESPIFVTTGSILLQKSFADSQQCYVWVRAVDTSGNAQAWTAFGSGFITNGLGNAQGQNLLNNPSFEIPADGISGDTVAQGWVNGGNNLGTVSLDSGNFVTGTQCLLTRQNPSVSVPASSSLIIVMDNSNYRSLLAKPGQWYVLRTKARYDRVNAQPAGLVNHVYMTIDFLDGTGTEISGTATNELLDAANGTGWQNLTCTLQAPANSYSILVRTFNIVTNTTGGALSTSSSFPCDARFDAVELIKAADSTTDELTKRGSTPPIYSGPITCTTTTTSILWSWNINILRTDLALTSQNLNSSQNTTGLAPTTTYYFYPYVNEDTIALGMVTGGSGSTGWAQTAVSRTLSQAQAQSNRCPLSLSPISVATPGGGTGVGGGGGDGICIRKGTFVKEKSRGVVLAHTLKKDEYVWSENDSWLRILEDTTCRLTDSFVHNVFDCGQVLDVTPGHSWTLRDGSSKKAAEINLLDEFICSTGVSYPIELKLLKEEDEKVIVKCETPHVFFAATILDVPWILTHNVINPSYL